MPESVGYAAGIPVVTLTGPLTCAELHDLQQAAER